MTRDALRTARITLTAALLCAGVAASSAQTVTPWSNLQTVFIIVLENHDWSEIKGNPSAPFINSLLSRFAHAERYFNPPGLHPSLPNYLWLEAGQNFGIFDDNPPAAVIRKNNCYAHVTLPVAQNGTRDANRPELVSR